MTILMHAIGYSCLAFSVVGFLELAVELYSTKTYILSHAIIYCCLFGTGLALL